MKYPPVCSAHWEGAVGQWLRNQLDARGIDAPAYGRYVLSLLTRPLDPADLNPSPIGNKMWELRSQSDWPPVKIEALKRSAAVQCLLNASDDQNSGIEQLIDELCLKLKEVDAQSSQIGKKEIAVVKNTRKDRSRPISPSEMARMYYAAFPALAPTTSVNPDPSQCNSRILTNAHKSRDIFGNKNIASNKDSSRSKKIGSKDRRSGIYRPHRNKKSGHHKNAQLDEELPEWVNDGDTWDIDSQDNLYEYAKLTFKDKPVPDESSINPSTKRLYERDSEGCINLDDYIFSKNCCIDDFKYSQSPTEEESMAKFKAKFDSSLEALWPKEQNNNDSELSMDFNDIIATPIDRMFNCYSADKPLPLSLTSSIWSNTDTKLDWENDLAIHHDDMQLRKLAPETNEPIADKPNLWQIDAYNKDSMEIIYNKLKPLNLDDSTDYSFKPNQWITNTPPLNWITKNPTVFDMNPSGFSNQTFNILNHNSSLSSFTEVVPKAPTGYIGDNLRRNNSHIRMEIPNPLNNSDEDDEDLLTSMRTHFRPIKHDPKDCTTIVNYADGMTFPIVSDLEYVRFNRSSSGTIFLESDTEPPTQYMEYRKQGIDYSRLDICASSLCSDDCMQQNDLVLKFRVCQTEKAVQTDDGIDDGKKLQSNPDENPADYLTNLLKTNVSVGSKESVNGNEMENLNYNWIQCNECKTNNNQWGGSDWRDSMNSSKIWSLNENHCKACSEQTIEGNNNNVGKSKLQEDETDRDWDDLLSDLKYVHDSKADNGWQDDLKTPSENGYIGSSEISYHAIEGNFIKGALLSEKTETSVIDDVRNWLANTVGKTENTVGRILDESVIMYSNMEPHCEMCAEDLVKTDESDGWRVDRKRRHSAVNSSKTDGAGKLRCTIAVPTNPPPRLPYLPTADRPLTR